MSNETTPSSRPGSDASKGKSTNAWKAVYIICVILFLAGVACHYQRGFGFTSLIVFGDQFRQEGLPANTCYIFQHTPGYDGQFYAKLALDPLLSNPSFDARQVDNLYYRSRRILLSWTAWLLGFGRPAWIVQVFALQNVACWLALAWLLLKWFPPRDFDNFVRWAGILFSCGLLNSVQGSLTDGPSLLLIALALYFYEEGRNIRGSIALGVAGLTRETSVLAFLALADPTKRTLHDFRKLVLHGILIVAPLICWLAYVKMRLGPDTSVLGTGQFDLPFAGIAGKWREIITKILQGTGRHSPLAAALLTHLAITTQVVFFLAKPSFLKPAWRVGFPFALMTLVFGNEMWRGDPDGVMRCVLPMTLAFNMLVPRGRKWMVLLLVGNLTVAFTPFITTSTLPARKPASLKDGRLLQGP